MSNLAMYCYLTLMNLLDRDEGQDLAEYAILLALIAIVVLVAVILLGQNISGVFSSMALNLGAPLSP